MGRGGGGEYTFQCVCECVCASAHVKKNRLLTYDSRIPCLPLEVGRTPTADETQVPFHGGTWQEKQTHEWKMPTQDTQGHVRTCQCIAATGRGGTQLASGY